MRIGLFTDTYLPVHNGISYVVQLARAGLEKLGHEVYVFAPKPATDYQEEDPHIIRFRAIKGVTYEEDFTSVFFPPSQLQKINKLNLDIIQFFTPNQVGLLGLMAGLRYDIPVISQYSTDLYQYVEYYPAAEKVILAFPIAAPIVLGGRWKKWGKALGAISKDRHVKTWLKRLTAEYVTSMHDKCDAVIVLSKKHQQQLSKWSTETDLHLIPTGINPLTRPSDAGLRAFKEAHGIGAQDKVILYAGRISKEKNLDLLLESFVRSIAVEEPRAKLVFAGDFDYREVLEQKARSSGFGERVVFTGPYVREQAGVIYAAADVFAFPSLTDTQGIVLHEAAGAGLPLVLCDGEISEVFHPGKNGLLAENEPVNYAAKILEILQNPKLSKAMSQRSLQFAAEYSEEEQLKKLEKLYKHCVETHKPLAFAGGKW